MDDIRGMLMNKKKSSMGFIIIISFVVLLLTTTSIIHIIVFSNWKASIDNIIVNMENDVEKDILDKIETFVNIPLYINETNHNLIEHEIIDVYDKKDREAFFTGVMKSSNREIYSFSYGTSSGEYYGARRNKNDEIEFMRSDAKTDGKSTYYAVTEDLASGEVVKRLGKFDPRTREWYKIAKEQGKPVFSPIYEHFVMNDLAITASYPIYTKEGALKGILGVHFTLSKINSYLEDVIKDKNATAYIVERDSGALVANSLSMTNFVTLEDGRLNRITIEEMDNKYILASFLNYKETSKNNHIIKTENDKLHINFTNYKKDGLDWLIITAIPESHFIDIITKNIFIALFLSILALGISIIIYIKNTKAILKPIYSLIEATEKFSQGNFLQRVEIHRNDEIGKISNAFNKMADQLYILISNLEVKVKERTRELEKANSALKESEENIRLLLNSTAEGIFGIDMNGKCTFCNASGLKMLGYEVEDVLIGKIFHGKIHYMHLDGTPIPFDECKIARALVSGESIHEENEIFWRADGSSFKVEYYSYPQYRNGKIIGAVITFMDITERKKTEEDIIYLSYHDQLTGLFNRRYFEEELKRLDSQRNLPLTVVMADMNGLKLVNDSLGHRVGDELLEKVAEVIKKACRKDDIIARLGGDEFVILLPKTGNYEAEQIIKRIEELILEERVDSVELSISFGYETKFNQEEEIQEIFKKAEDRMYKKKLFESPSMRGKTVNTIIRTLHEKNRREEEHAHRVSALCKSIGEALGLSVGDIEELKTVGLLHDIGKIAIEDRILSKSGKLTDGEWEEIKRHPEIGYRILSTVNDMAEMAEYVLAHHERWDGMGYPKGLKGIEIPLLSRIIAIADTYDAMTSDRSYRDALSKEAAIEELQMCAGIQFDPEIVDVFIAKVINKPLE
jgi:diguanylate cyclase (GGDEF)-like protein/PAS domain S-box-containing protein